ncbi:murein L,D-transpeptidase catalytic domain-containing protein [Chryseobacterium echinoideorum]|uniref:murein L,D-transpeptidase catalytic domain-containing protein n=1 Tax=Chryseobacterium echinoideorum TaxID=1549648 RepID=UPI001185F991|nr:murein L,D-transpeptidase catalytic domain family protein [Chryseobacterium echinoideorum]
MRFLVYIFIFFLSCNAGKAQEKKDVLPKEKITELKSFLKNKNYNQDLAIFINFKIHSGKYRYIVYDLKNDKVLQKAIVSHGSGSVIPNSDKLRFSNTENSYQSSLGKYEVQESYEGKFGKSYRMKGLDSSNSNARQRAIVLHSYSCIPDQESSRSACLSLGCPMLSKKAFQETAKFLDSSKKPVILYAFY